jgi:hypothetical protein
MPSLTVEYATEAERLELERAIAYVIEMRKVASTAAFGTVLAACESHALDAGRQMLRGNLESAIQSHVDAQKKRRVPVQKDGTVATS